MPRVKTRKQLLFGDQRDANGRILGTVAQDVEIDLDDRTAAYLLAKGAVCSPPRPEVIYETKVIVPEAPQARPFRDVHHADDTQPVEVDSAGDQSVEKSNLASRVAGVVGRKRGRPRKHPAR